MTALGELCLPSKHLFGAICHVYMMYECILLCIHVCVQILILHSSFSILPPQHPDLPSPVLHPLTDVSTSLTHLLSTSGVPLTGQHSLTRSLERAKQVQEREVRNLLKYICSCTIEIS